MTIHAAPAPSSCPRIADSVLHADRVVLREVVGPARGESPSAPHPSSKTLDLECSQ